MNIAGIDYSTQAVDIVTVPYDQPGTPDWHRFPLQGDGAFERARDVANELPGRHSLFWDDILAVGIEHPGGRYGTGAMLRIQGAILSVIPARMLVISLPPGRWRKLNGLSGSASKTEVARRSRALADPYESHRAIVVRPDIELTWAGVPQDAHDAHLIALATSSLIAPTVAA
jgi:hypothetical protein